MQQFLKSKGYAFLLISVIAFIAFWDVTTMQHTLKWDMIDANLPFQALQSQMEHNGEIPLWDPYTYLGNAMHAKMSQWYPMRFISSKISIYSLAKLNIEFLLHIILAGFGMFLIARKLKFEFYIAISLAIAYMLSGFFTGNAQHMGWIISGALLPFIVLLYYEFITKPDLKISLLFAFVLFSFIVGGYPAFSVTVLYGLVLVFIWKTISLLRTKKYSDFQSLLMYHGISLIPLVLLLSITIVSHFDMVQAITRGSGISLDYALGNSLQVKHFITFLFPFLIVFTKNNFWHIDPSMMNCYIGLSVFILAIYSIRFIRNRHILMLWISALFFFSLSMGQELPIRSFFYHYIPLFDTFRFPSLFRLFFMFNFILLAGYSIQQLQNKSTKIFVNASLIIAIVFLLFALFLLAKKDIFQFQEYINWDQIITTFSKAQILFFQSCLWSLIAFIVFIVGKIMIRKNPRYSGANILLLFVALEMVFVVLFSSAFTVTNPCNPIKIQGIVSTLPSNFMKPDIAQPTISQYNKALKIERPLWRNNQIFYKRMTYDGYTSFVYTSTEKFEKSRIYDSVKKYPLAYIPASIYSESDTIFDYSKGKIAVISENKLHSCNSKAARLTITEFHPNKFIFRINTNEPIPFVLMQNYYPGWKVYVNSVEVPIMKANFCCMAVNVSAGNSVVKFEYAPRKIVFAYYIFEITLYLLIMVLVFLAIPKENKKLRMTIGISIALFFLCIEVKNNIAYSSSDIEKDTLSMVE